MNYLKDLVYALAALQPLSMGVGGVLGYMFGGKVVEYVTAAVKTVYADIKAKL